MSETHAASAYGHRWGAHDALRLSARNSGMFYIRATVETVRMMGRLKERMQREAVWDQTAYNEEMWWAHTSHANSSLKSHSVRSAAPRNSPIP